MAYNQKIMRMKELIEKLTEADIAYYKNDDPIMTDREYDLLFDELAKLETETSLMLSGSPTQKVSGEILESLTPVTRSKPMLSADKTKSVDDLIKFAAGKDALLSWKLDGLTIVIRYKDGKLKQAITRGAEGIVGEDLRGIKHEYRRKGVLLIAAAIGDDKESIERIYGDSFMDITDLEQLPAKLTSVIKRHIRV